MSAPHRGRLRCGRLQTVPNVTATTTTRKQESIPQDPEVKREPFATRSEKSNERTQPERRPGSLTETSVRGRCHFASRSHTLSRELSFSLIIPLSPALRGRKPLEQTAGTQAFGPCFSSWAQFAKKRTAQNDSQCSLVRQLYEHQDQHCSQVGCMSKLVAGGWSCIVGGHYYFVQAASFLLSTNQFHYAPPISTRSLQSKMYCQNRLRNKTTEECANAAQS